MTTKEKTREQWLTEAMDAMRPWFIAKETPIPAKVYVGVGWVRGLGKRAIGVCHPATHIVEEDKRAPSIWICPTQGADPIRVLDILLHELCHAALPPGTGHKKPFKDLARAFGLEGPVTATIVTEGTPLWLQLKELSDKLGPYPHAVMRKPVRAAASGGTSNGWVRLKSRIDSRYKLVISEKSLLEFGYPVDFAGHKMVRVGYAG